MRRALLILAFVAIPPLLHAQVVGQPQQITIVDSGTACVTAPTACATFALDSQTGGLTLSISGTWTGTLTFEGTNNDGIWTSVLATNLATGAQATTTTASGLFSVTNAGVIKVRARATAAMTGSALVTAAKGIGFARLFGPSPTFTTVLVGDGSASAPAYSFVSEPTFGLYRVSAGVLGLTGDQTSLRVVSRTSNNDGNVLVSSSGSGNAYIGLGTNGTFDVDLFRGGPNILEQRNGTNAQTFNVYGSTNGTDKSYLSFTGGTTSTDIQTLRTGSGSLSDLRFGAAGAGIAWVLKATTGHFIGITPSAGLGYGTGAGGTVNQATSKATGVTLNTVSGQITMNAAALAAGAKVSFVVTNSAVAATDGPFVWVTSGGTANAYRASVTAVAAGSFTVTVENITAGSLSEAPVIGFNLMKGASS